MRKAALRSSFSTNSGTVIASRSLIMLLNYSADFVLVYFFSFFIFYLFFNHSNILWEIKKERKYNYKSNLMKWTLKIKIVKNCGVRKIAVSYCILHLRIFLIFWENIFGPHILTLFSIWLSSCHCFHSIFIFLNLNILLPFIISLTVNSYSTGLNCTTSLKMVFL